MILEDPLHGNWRQRDSAVKLSLDPNTLTSLALFNSEIIGIVWLSFDLYTVAGSSLPVSRHGDEDQARARWDLCCTHHLKSCQRRNSYPGLPFREIKNMKNMKNMKNIKNMKNMKNMKNIKNMKNMMNMKNMKKMKNMKNMRNMKMKLDSDIVTYSKLSLKNCTFVMVVLYVSSEDLNGNYCSCTHPVAPCT